MIDNFKTIENFMQFEEGTFYKFELLVRNTDGENELFPERCSNTNRNILIKSWYVDNFDYYNKIKHEMVTMANLTGARLYITLDRKDNVKLVQNLVHSFTDTLCAICNGQKPSIKNIAKTFASETSKVENSSKSTKTLMWDVDTKDKDALKAINDYIIEHGQKPYVLETKKGYHVFCYRKFNHADWFTVCSKYYCDESMKSSYIAVQEYIEQFRELVSVKENELGLVYHPEGSKLSKAKITHEELQSQFDDLMEEFEKRLDKLRIAIKDLYKSKSIGTEPTILLYDVLTSITAKNPLSEEKDKEG